ncbi:MAG: 16S rRNA (adenine(1518)-N(6)/adenine(1519)-N(6))-dimethyltransferase RsmA [Clostridia bacterium]|nr:16S rRNA (adenine(1518)-N(6)/adenine(1519)-N(6))-dimethyltransferase RsmA [Clostridia bacterium]
MNPADFNTLKSILKAEGFDFKKSLGQNFLIDSTVCPMMAEASCDEQTGVLEIGPGAGVLTAQLCDKAKKVVAVELDERLRPVLAKTLKDKTNVEIIFGDAMKLDLAGLIKEKFSDCKRVAVCANLPYYITSPMIMYLLESRLPIDNITVMVQKEAAERLCAKVGSREAGAVTVAVSYYSEGEILFEVKREAFMPAPNVDSAVIQLRIRKEPSVKVNHEEKFFRFVKACFAQRRKTLINTLASAMGANKARLREILLELGLPETVRSEQLDMNLLAEISNRLN